MEMDITLSLQEAALAELLERGAILDDDATIKRNYCYYIVTYDPATRIIQSFERNEKKIEKTRCLSGFFSIITHAVDFDAMKAFHIYGLRDE